MSLLRRIPWWAWLVLPGGLVVALFARSRRNISAVGIAPTPANNAAAVQAKTQTLIENAQVQADTLRKALAGDPLAATLAGVNPSLVAAPADAGSQAAGIKAQIQSLTDEAAAHEAAYSRDHDGGQSAAQENNFQNGLSAQIAALQSKLSGLFS